MNSPLPLPDGLLRGHDGPVLFILDAGNGLEKRLLEDCLAGRDDSADRVFLKISRDYESSDVSELVERLGGADGTLLVPARVAWLMPGSEHEANKPLALRHLVFGDPRRPGALRGHWILRRYPERVQCMAAEPATIGDLRQRYEAHHDGGAEEDREDFAAFVVRQAGLALEIAEWGLIGRRYKAPRFIAESLRSSPKFRAALRAFSRESGRPLEELRSEADGYMKEIISVPSALGIDLRARFENWVMRLSYNGDVVYHERDLERLRAIVQSHPSMLLFTHKTYIDSMALTTTLFERDFPMVHIFAGINMSFSGLGLLLRNSGGIFIRRTFRDKPLYKIVLRHYIGYLMEKRFPMSWAFEGTRSRTGKLMPPRLGLLSYVLEGAHATDARNMHIVPVTVSYDLMRDVQDYASEQTGRVKKPETLKWFIGYLSSLRQPMGRIYLDIGEPVLVERAPDPDDRLALPKVAFEVAVQANRVTPITLPAVCCMALLGAAPRALTIEELQAEAIAIVRWVHARGVRLTSDFKPDRLAHVQELTDAMVDIGLLIRYDEGSDTVFGIEPDQHPMATYYRNSIIHHFVNKAIIELALLEAAAVPADRALQAFWNETLRLRDCFKFEFFYPRKKKFRHQLEVEMDRAGTDWRERMEAGGQEVLTLLGSMKPHVAHASLLPYVESYSVVFSLLARLDAGEGMAQEDCVPQALKQGKQAYLQRRITSEASIGKLLFQNGFRLAENLGLTEGGGENVARARARLLRDFRELSRRLDRIRLIALSGHGDQ